MNMDAGTAAAVIGAFNIAATVGGGFFFMGVFKGRLDRVETDIKETKGLLVTSAVEVDRLRRAEADIDNIEDDLRKLRRGVGWINDDKAPSVNREY